MQQDFILLGDITSYEVKDNRVLLVCGAAKVELQILAPDLLRVRLAPQGVFEPDHSWAVVKRDWPPADFKVEDAGEVLRIRTAELIVEVKRSPCRLAILDTEGFTINSDYPPYGIGWSGRRVKCWKSLEYDEHFYGFGEKTGRLDKRRSVMVMWNTDAFGYGPETDPLYKSIPFFIGLRRKKAYGIFFDNTYKTIFDMGHTAEDFYSFEADGGELNYYFIYGPSVKKVIERYTELTGRPLLHPRWALGHQQSRYSYYPAERLLLLADEFRKTRIPCDVFYLDIHYKERYQSFTWDRNRFSDPARLVSEMRAKGFRLIPIVNPGVKADPSNKIFVEGVQKDYFCKYATGELYLAKVWPGTCAFPDFTREDVREWWGSLHAEYVKLGLAGIWNDMNEPAVFVERSIPRQLASLLEPYMNLMLGRGAPYIELMTHRTMDLDVIHYDRGQNSPHEKIHNVYGLLMCMATYEGLKRLMPNKRPFILTRAAYAGIQRYSAVWTGDNTSSWEHLALQIPMLLNLGLSGVPMAGDDIGGFASTATPELLTRWYQIGAFIPLCRNHTILGSFDQEAWVYGEKYLRVIREFLELRYQLIPYLYTLLYQASKTGHPIIRPLLLEHQDDPNTYTIQDEFLVGEFILVAPIIHEDSRRRIVYLPKGEWIDYWSESKHQGPAYLEVDAPIDRAPIFIKSGTILPMQPSMLYVDEKPADTLFIHVYPSDKPSMFTLYEDDGETRDYEKGIYLLTPFTFTKEGDRLVLQVGDREGAYKPSPRSFMIIIHLVEKKPTRVSLNDAALTQATSPEEMLKAEQGWIFDDAKKLLQVKIRDNGKRQQLTINLS
ncbi:MAG: glycoside hydrolase family 31 protein [Nitrososphaerota archaeon]